MVEFLFFLKLNARRIIGRPQNTKKGRRGLQMLSDVGVVVAVAGQEGGVAPKTKTSWSSFLTTNPKPRIF